MLQEIFGVNTHIQEVANGYASHGLRVLAPALFDRLERKVDLGYGPEDIQKGFSLRSTLDIDQAMLDIQASVDALKQSGVARVALVGYCFGGTLAWLAAARVEGLAAVSSYYAGGIGHFTAEQSRCPVQFHFGERDQHIPLSDVEAISKASPAPEVHLYPADHGFNCNHRPSYDEAAATLAGNRTLSFFKQALKGNPATA